jgi:hypothetical protein
MSKNPRQISLPAAITLVMLSLFALLSLANKTAFTKSPGVGPLLASRADTNGDGLAELTSLSHHSTEPSPSTPDQNLCLHCHLSGENTEPWVPVGRWWAFGVAGLVFAFGMYRSASVWLTRKPWKPLSGRVINWIDERYTIREPLARILNRSVPRHATRWFYCLGGITAFLFVVQAVTGIFLAVYYKPTPTEAYASIQFIETQVYFGAAMRAIHHWAASGMIIMCVAHALRVFITGAYKAPRELNWVGGVLLLILTLAFGFTGYLLPWDQRAYWATTVGTEIAGSVPDFGTLVLVFLRAGWAVTDLTLSRFYAAHILIIPLMTVLLMGLHFLMVRRQGIAEPL